MDLRSDGDQIVAKHLLQALDAAQGGLIADAKTHVATAKQLAPEWYEVHRVDASVRVKDGDIAGAQEAFEGAVELGPESAALRLRYGMFRLDHLDDPAGAIEELSLALERDPHALDCRLELVRAYQRALQFDEAQRNLNELFLQRVRLSPYKLRMLHDLELQQWMRRAAHLGEHGEPARGVRALASMKKAYEGCPVRLRDDRIQRRLTQVIPVARRLARRCEDDDANRQVQRFIDWAVATERGSVAEPELTPGVQARGTIVNLVPDRGFGFVRLADGADVFLHYSQLECNESDVRVGDEFVFELGQGREGLQALKARRAPALVAG